MATFSVRRPSLLSDRQVRELTGLSLKQFGDLLAELGPEWEADRVARLSSKERRRDLGGGRRYQTVFAGRLFLTLVYLRWNVTYRMLAALVGVSKDTVNRAVAEITPLLAKRGITTPGGERAGDETGLRKELERLSATQRGALVDGSFVPIPRPSGSWEAQKRQYSGHRHRHCKTFQTITDDQGHLLWAGEVRDGSTHDLTALAESEAAGPLADSGVTVIGDKAYAGMKDRLGLAGAFTPKRRRKDDQRAEQIRKGEKEFNTEVARQRVHVEHGIRRLKIHRVLHGYRRRQPTLVDTLRACASLATMPT